MCAASSNVEDFDSEWADPAWGVRVPGLTVDRAEELLAALRARKLDYGGEVLSSRGFWAYEVDRPTAQTLANSLSPEQGGRSRISGPILQRVKRSIEAFLAIADPVITEDGVRARADQQVERNPVEEMNRISDEGGANAVLIFPGLSEESAQIVLAALEESGVANGATIVDPHEHFVLYFDRATAEYLYVAISGDHGDESARLVTVGPKSREEAIDLLDGLETDLQEFIARGGSVDRD